MSKAFTRESDEAGVDDVLIRPQVARGVKRYITRQGADRLRQQATVLLDEKRFLVEGDSSRSSDITAKVRRIEATIQRITQILDSVIVAEPPADRGRIGFGASIRIRDEHGEEETYQIVGPDETEPGQARISSVSPLAQALMNRRPGETVHFQSPAGEQALTVLSVEY